MARRDGTSYRAWTMKYWILVAVLATTAGWNPGLQADIVIDNFSNGAILAQIGAGTINRTTAGGGIYGGNRDESLTVTIQGGNEVFGILGFGSGGLSVGQSINDEIFGSLTYNDFSSIDFTDGGVYRFRLDFSSSDSPFDLNDVMSITVTSGASSSTVMVDVPGNAALPGPTFVLFNDFSGVDFTQVDSIELGFDLAGFPGNDFGINGFVAAIPEPSFIGLALMVIGGCLWRRTPHRAR